MEIDIDTFHHCNCFWDLNYNKAVSGKSDQSCQYRMRFFAEGLMNHLTVKETVKILTQIQGQEKNEEDTDWEE